MALVMFTLAEDMLKLPSDEGEQEVVSVEGSGNDVTTDGGLPASGRAVRADRTP